LYERVAELAAEKGLTICKIEKMAGIANGTIGRWRKQDARGKTIVKLAKALNVSTDYLLGMTDKR